MYLYSAERCEKNYHLIRIAGCERRRLHPLGHLLLLGRAAFILLRRIGLPGPLLPPIPRDEGHDAAGQVLRPAILRPRSAMLQGTR